MIRSLLLSLSQHHPPRHATHTHDVCSCALTWNPEHFQEVDVAHKKAKIVYYTGEIEELNLPDIVRDRHMSLLPRS